MIIKISQKNIEEAAKIHSISWKDSHKEFCSREFIKMHSIENQKKYLLNEIKTGKALFMLIEEYPVGIISMQNNLIENLYILPTEQHKGYGTKLLLFAIDRCKGETLLWILENNKNAYNLYLKYGFKKTGNINVLSENLSEVELKKIL